MVLPPVERSEYEEYVTAAKRAMDERDFTAAWAEGRAMSLEEAAASALS
jgi:hypothetical protein